jgi:hypothetical protein
VRWAFVAAIVLVASPALAQPSSNAVAAEELFRQGRAMLEKHDLREACEKLEKSEKLDRAVGTLFSLGECYEQQARVASAWFTFREAVALAAQRGDARQLLAQHRADALQPRLARLVIHVDPHDGGISVRVDGQPIDQEALNTPLPVDPGIHHVEASLDHRWASDVEVPDNGASVAVDVPSLVAPVAPAAPAGPPAWRRPTSITLIGVGAATAGVGAIFGMQAIVKGRDVNGSCPSQGSTCSDRSAVQENGTAQTDADVATVLIPIGVVVAAVGGVLLATTGATVETTASTRDARVSFRWAW